MIEVEEKQVLELLEKVEKGMKSHEEICKLFYEAIRMIPRWIPVSERLPDWRDGKVLVFTKYGFSICERTVNSRWKGTHANWITHWMPLPNPPEGECR